MAFVGASSRRTMNDGGRRGCRNCKEEGSFKFPGLKARGLSQNLHHNQHVE
jgi:hypothetical protein